MTPYRRRFVIPRFIRKTDYSVAGLWINFAKFLLALAFGLQQILLLYIGLQLFGAGVSKFILLVPSKNGAQVVTEQKNEFVIPYLPIALLPTDGGRLVVRSINSPTGPVLPAGLNTHEFQVGNLIAGQAIRTARFTLSGLLGKTPAPGKYTVHFCVEFDKKGSSVGETELATTELECIPETAYGDYPIVSGDTVALPATLTAALALAGNPPLTVKSITAKGASTPATNLKIDVDQQKRILLIKSAPCWNAAASLNYFEMNAEYKDPAGTPHPVKITFVIRKPKDPMATATLLAHTVLYYTKDRYKDSGYEFFYLDRFIIDPEGRDSLRPSKIQLLSGPAGKYDVRNENKEWRLQIQPGKTPTTPAGDLVALRVTGSCGAHSDITFKILR